MFVMEVDAHDDSAEKVVGLVQHFAGVTTNNKGLRLVQLLASLEYNHVMVHQCTPGKP